MVVGLEICSCTFWQSALSAAVLMPASHLHSVLRLAPLLSVILDALRSSEPVDTTPCQFQELSFLASLRI